MRSLQQYKDIYREIAQNLGIRGDSVDLLVHLLANATYIEEVENITYMEEASLERASLLNSKIQHCVNSMYSVRRGFCPRVIVNIRPNKELNLIPYETEIATSSNFKVYYLGWLDRNKIPDWDKNTSSGYLAPEEAFEIGPRILQPSETTEVILGLICKEAPYTYNGNSNNYKKISETNKYYIDILETGLSNDAFVKVIKSPDTEFKTYPEYALTTRFEDHLMKKRIYDLTLPGFGSRLYFQGTGLEENDALSATYFKLTYLDSILPNELKKISINSASMIGPKDDTKWKQFLESRNLEEYNEKSPGLVIIPETSRDSLQEIHYKASRDRYVNSIIRSNKDLGRFLEEKYSSRVRPGGTKCSFLDDMVVIYYIPEQGENLLTTKEIREFKEEYLAYYITTSLDVQRGVEYRILIDIDLELNSTVDLSEEIDKIISPFEYKFDVNFNDSEVVNKLATMLSKISAVNVVNSIDIHYASSKPAEDSQNHYYNITYTIRSSYTSPNEA